MTDNIRYAAMHTIGFVLGALLARYVDGTTFAYVLVCGVVGAVVFVVLDALVGGVE